MKDVKRYNHAVRREPYPMSRMYEHLDGKYVEYSDYEALQQRFTEAEKKLATDDELKQLFQKTRCECGADEACSMLSDHIARNDELEQRLAKANARIAELKIKEFMYDEHSDAVKKCLALNKQLVATEKALRWVCDVYIVGHYYSDDQRKEQLERTVRRVMVKANGGEE